MKKIISLFLIILLFVVGCSDVIKVEGVEAKLAFDPTDVKSIMKLRPIILVVSNLEYKETVMQKNSIIPYTIYKLDDMDVLKGDNKKERSLIAIEGGIVTLKQLYEHSLIFNKKGDDDQMIKPSKSDENKKVKRYINNYLELNKGEKYLIFVNASRNYDRYYTDPYCVFKYSEKNKSYSNEFSGLVIKESDKKKWR